MIGVILAGGDSRRMAGGDKCLSPLGGRPLLAHVIERLAPQVDSLVLSANGNPARFASFGLPVLADAGGEPLGPLAGILAGMRWAEKEPARRLIATVPADAPFFPRDLVVRLAERLGDAEVAIARSGGQLHPVVGLWSVTLADDLATWLGDDTHRKVGAWVASRNHAVVDFEGNGFDPFFNVNTPDDLRTAVSHVGKAD
jgi:molybdenum cofactor guanylyltransferase